ncbi:MerR family transcriptional regulator [Novosphingobium aquimarinum]|uniref:MerR family transcriptional regulator n=1 Tax=Novosphingobium aquimarinum TaxID=2682494 RepID=UPI0012EB56BE|nr:MerR family DNA-binding transcriptional regulator [Novosphingobium aquimarinum]
MSQTDGADDLGDEFIGIHEAAKRLGVTMRTLRFYEDKGLISPRRAGTTRIYSRREMGRMRLILRGKALGFAIRDIGEFLDLYEVDPEHNEQARRLIERVSERVADLRNQRKAIDQTIAELRAIEQQAHEWLAEHARRGADQGAQT